MQDGRRSISRNLTESEADCQPKSEALEGEDIAVAAMLEQAVKSICERGMRAVPSGFAAFIDYPYAIDNYDLCVANC